MSKILFFVGLAFTLQLSDNQIECVAQSYPLTMAKPLGPVGGIAVEHPLQATVYAYRRGKMKLLVPFEITVVPMGGIEPERPAPVGYPVSCSISNQHDSHYTPTSGYPYRPQSSVYNTGYHQPVLFNYPQQTPFYPSYYNQVPYRNPYVQPTQTKPFPQYKPFQQKNATNATQDWNPNSTAINISSLVNNATHPSNAFAPNTTEPNQSASVHLTILLCIFVVASATNTIAPSGTTQENPESTNPTEPPIQEVQTDSGYVIPQNFAPEVNTETQSEEKKE